MAPALAAFKAKWQNDAPEFFAYFDKEWIAAQKFRMWIAAYRGPDVPNTTGALESYHGVIKLLFASSRCAGFYKWVLQLGFTTPKH